MQNNLKRVRHQGSRELKSAAEKFRAQYACYCRNRPLLQRLINHELGPMVDYAVRTHLLNCYRCRQVYAELEDLSEVKQKAEDATDFLLKVTLIDVAQKPASQDNRRLLREQKMLLDEAEEALKRLKQ